jgi:hypothetical protein
MSPDEQKLRKLAGDRAYERGAVYARQGRVQLDPDATRGARAIVRGTDDYETEIRVTARARFGAATVPLRKMALSASISSRSPSSLDPTARAHVKRSSGPIHHPTWPNSSAGRAPISSPHG